MTCVSGFGDGVQKQVLQLEELSAMWRLCGRMGFAAASTSERSRRGVQTRSIVLSSFTSHGMDSSCLSSFAPDASESFGSQQLS